MNKSRARRRKSKTKRRKSKTKVVKSKYPKNKCSNEKYNFLFSEKTKIKLGRFYYKLISKNTWNFPSFAPRTIKVFSEGKKYVFANPKILGIGGFGAVFVYKDVKNSLEIILKVEGGKNADFFHNRRLYPSEKEISEVLQKEDSCNVIRTRYIESRGLKYYRDHYYIMEKFDGNCQEILHNLIENNIKNKNKIWLNIVEEVRKQIICIAKLGFYYTDLKPDNILFCDNGNGLFSFHLGDLGSAIPTPDFIHIGPYIPPEYKDKDFSIIRNDKNDLKRAKAAIIFLLGMLALLIVENYDKHIYIGNFYEYLFYEDNQDNRPAI